MPEPSVVQDVSLNRLCRCSWSANTSSGTLGEGGPALLVAAGTVAEPSLEGDDMAKRTCSIDGCESAHYGRGFCAKHWARWKRHGDPLAVGTFVTKMTVEEALWDRVDVGHPLGCWEFTGPRSPEGYGRAAARQYAHRWAYELLVGPIPHGLHLDHLCRVRHCVNVDHLEPVTPAENTRRGASRGVLNRRARRCSKGHPQTPANVYIRPDGHGTICRPCKRERDRGYQAVRPAPLSCPRGHEYDGQYTTRGGITKRTCSACSPRQPTRLTADVVLEARHACAAGVSVSTLAERYGVGYDTIYAALIGRSWKRVGGPTGPVSSVSSGSRSCGWPEEAA